MTRKGLNNNMGSLSVPWIGNLYHAVDKLYMCIFGISRKKVQYCRTGLIKIVQRQKLTTYRK